MFNPFIETWAGRLERTQDLMYTAVDRTSDRVYEYLEWPVEHWEFVKTVRWHNFVMSLLCVVTVEDSEGCCYCL